MEHGDHSPTSLDELGLRHGTDKASNRHDYLRIYEPFVQRFRDLPVRLMEIGVLDGASLRMWRDYFPNGHIVGVDLKKKAEAQAGERIEIRVCDQSNRPRMEKIARIDGPFDIIIEDGSHIWAHQILCIQALIPLVKPNGLYITEDLHTSYGERATDYSAGSVEPATDYIHRIADAVMLPHKIRTAATTSPNSTDPFLLAAPRLLTAVTSARKCTIFHRSIIKG